MPDLFWDVESRSAASLRLVGAWNYSAHPTTEILCLCFVIDDGEVKTWLPGQPVPAPFLAAARDPDNWRLIAHNFEFERAMLENVLIPNHGFPAISLEAQPKSLRRSNCVLTASSCSDRSTTCTPPRAGN